MNNLKFMISVFFSVFLLTLALSPTLSIKAQEEATQSSTVDPETVKQNIKKRIQEVVEGSQTVLGSSEQTIRGWLGFIETITTDTITISGPDSTRLIAISTDTVIVKEGKNVESSDLAIGNFVIAMGRPDNNNILNTLRLVASEDEPEKPAQKILAGTLDSIDAKQDLIVISSPAGTTTTTYTTTSIITDQLETKDELDLDDLHSGDQVIAVYLASTKDPSVLNLLRLHRTKSSSTPSPSPQPTQ